MDNVRAVCLPTGSERYANKTGTVVGWGSIKEQGPQPDELREVTVRIWDNPTCKSTYGNAAPGGIMDHMLCAGQKGKDSCSVSRHRRSSSSISFHVVGRLWWPNADWRGT